MFVLADEKGLCALLEDAGFASTSMQQVPVRIDYPDVDEYNRRSSEMGEMFLAGSATAW
jgi:hypothetical protein